MEPLLVKTFPEDKIKKLLHIPGFPKESNNYLLSKGFRIANDRTYVLDPKVTGNTIHIELKDGNFIVSLWNTKIAGKAPIVYNQTESIQTLKDSIEYIQSLPKEPSSVSKFLDPIVES